MLVNFFLKGWTIGKPGLITKQSIIYWLWHSRTFSRLRNSPRFGISCSCNFHWSYLVSVKWFKDSIPFQVILSFKGVLDYDQNIRTFQCKITTQFFALIICIHWLVGSINYFFINCNLIATRKTTFIKKTSIGTENIWNWNMLDINPY